MKVAIVHDWLVSYRGGEKVLKAICELYPEAPIYTLFYDKSNVPEFFHNRTIKYPKILNTFKRFRKALLPVLPFAIEAIDLCGYDLVISTSSCVAKGVITDPECIHICYIHSPMRYVWDQRNSYFKGISKVPLLRSTLHFFSTVLRQWDVISSFRVDKFIANSSFVATRVKSYYNREAEIIHPPLGYKNLSEHTRKSDYYLVAGAMVSYKRFDLAIDACIKSNRKIIVAGDGPYYKKLKKEYSNKNVTFVNSPDDKQFIELLKNSKALIFPGVEDFGMIAIEAMACGTPVIAYSKGGAKDFIQDGENGIFFQEQNFSSLINGLEKFEKTSFSSKAISESSQKFSYEKFKEKIRLSISHSIGDRI